MNLNKFNTNLAKIRKINAVKKEERYKLDILQLKKGGCIKIFDTIYIVEDSFTYQYKNDEPWTELQLLNPLTGVLSYIEIEVDDEISICLTEKKMKLRELNISSDKVEEIAEDEEGEIEVNGITYHYEDDYQVKFKRSGSSKSEKVYLYEFESDNKEFLTVEEWGEESEGFSYEVFLSIPISIDSIEIIDLG